MAGKMLHRITFSLSLAKHIAKTAGPQYTVKRLTFTVGDCLEPGEESPSGLYCIMSRKTSSPLRVTLFKDVAELITDDSRYIAICWPTVVKDIER